MLWKSCKAWRNWAALNVNVWKQKVKYNPDHHSNPECWGMSCRTIFMGCYCWRNFCCELLWILRLLMKPTYICHNISSLIVIVWTGYICVIIQEVFIYRPFSQRTFWHVTAEKAKVFAENEWCHQTPEHKTSKGSETQIKNVRNMISSAFWKSGFCSELSNLRGFAF